MFGARLSMEKGTAAGYSGLFHFHHGFFPLLELQFPEQEEVVGQQAGLLHGSGGFSNGDGSHSHECVD